MQRQGFGGLKVPENAVVRYLEPGVNAKTKKGAKLYLPREGQILERDVEAICQNQPQRLKEEDIIVAPLCVQLQDELAGKTEIHNVFLKAIRFELKAKQSNLPEAQQTITLKEVGLMSLADVVLDKQFNRVITGEIFPHGSLPTTADIKQSTLGDCFLLAAIIAILEAKGGPQSIYDMMKQEGTHTVVRLYNPLTLQPEYIRISNTELHSASRQFLSETIYSEILHRAPWVHILEKAYAAFAYKYNDKNEIVHVPNEASYLGMYTMGGRSNLAFTILRGSLAKCASLPKNTINNGFLPWEKALNVVLGLAPRIRHEADLAPNELADSFAQVKELLDLNFPTIDITVWEAYARFVANMNVAEYETIAAVFEATKNLNDAGKDPTEILQKLTEAKLPPPIRTAFSQWVFDEVPYRFNGAAIIGVNNAPLVYYQYPHALGSGIYTKQQLDLFYTLASNQEKGDLFAAGSRADLNNVPGLRAPHAYAISKVFAQEINGVVLRFFELINPWGRTGRVYNWNDMKNVDPQEKDCGIESTEMGRFAIELTDFTRYFDSLYEAPRLLPSMLDELAAAQSALQSSVSVSIEPIKLREFSYASEQVSFKHSHQLTADWIKNATETLPKEAAKRFLSICLLLTFAANSALSVSIEKALREVTEKPLVNPDAQTEARVHGLIHEIYPEDLPLTLNLQKGEFLKALFAYIFKTEKTLLFKMIQISTLFSEARNNMLQSLRYAQRLIITLLDKQNENLTIPEVILRATPYKPPTIQSELQTIITKAQPVIQAIVRP